MDTVWDKIVEYIYTPDRILNEQSGFDLACGYIITESEAVYKIVVEWNNKTFTHRIHDGGLWVLNSDQGYSIQFSPTVAVSGVRIKRIKRMTTKIKRQLAQALLRKDT